MKVILTIWALISFLLIAGEAEEVPISTFLFIKTGAMISLWIIHKLWMWTDSIPNKEKK